MRNLKLKKTVICRISVLLCLMFLFAASAQAQLTGYPGKLVCGYEIGDIPLLSDPAPLQPPRPYENFKPGNYATVFNILNLNATPQTVSFLLTLDNAGPFLLFNITINAFASVDVGCVEVLGPFFPPLIGQRIEGMLIPVTPNANFIVDTVYTYMGKDRFSEHRVYTGTGTSDPTLGTALDVNLTGLDPTPGENIVAASGAGGLGLGGSIDVVRIDPVAIPAGMVPDTEIEPPFEP